MSGGADEMGETAEFVMWVLEHPVLRPLIDAEVRAGVDKALGEAADAMEDECTQSTSPCFCGSAEWLRARAKAHDGCDCTELCAMGPTCPGGMLAGLPDAGCWRTEVSP